MDWKSVLGILQKPQSIATGATVGLLNMIKPGLDPRGQEIRDRYEAAKAAGQDTSAYEPYLHSIDNIHNPLEGILAGLKGSLNPARAIAEASGSNQYEPGGDTSTGLQRLLHTGQNVVFDPLNFVGPLGKSAAVAGKLGRASEAVDAALTVGKLGEDATRGQKLAQFGRQWYQGTTATGDPLSGLGVGLMGRSIEKRLASLAAKRAAGAGVDAAEEALGNTANTINDAAELASQPAKARFDGIPAGSQQRFPDSKNWDLGPLKTPEPTTPPKPPWNGVIPGQGQFNLNPKALPVGSGEGPNLSDVMNNIRGTGQVNMPPVSSPIPGPRPVMGELMPPAQGQLNLNMPPEVEQSWAQNLASHPYEAQSSVPQIAMPQQMSLPGMGNSNSASAPSVSDDLVQKLMEILNNQKSPTATLARSINPKVR